MSAVHAPKLRRSVAALVALPVALAALPTLAQPTSGGFPNRPITVVVPYAPGGPTDSAARLVAEEWGRRLGQPMVVANRAGAATIVGADAVRAAPADGYTVLLGTGTTFSINPVLYRNLKYTSKDFEPIGAAALLPYVVLVPNRMPARSIGEFATWARAQPNGFTYGTVGLGSSAHVIGEALTRALGTKSVAVHYKGSAPVGVDLVAGQLDLSIDPLNTSLPLHKAGRARIIAVIGDRRWPELPDVPTLAEAGVPGVEGAAWAAFFVPAGTPQNVVAQLSSTLAQVVRLPDMEPKMRDLGMLPMRMSPAEFGRFLERDAAWWRKVVEENGIRLEQ